MKKLFILGNGFDLAHQMKTSYSDFHKYIRVNYFNIDEDDGFDEEFYDNVDLPTSIMGNHGEEFFEDNEDLLFIGKVISAVENGSNWCQLESSLAQLDFSEFLDDWDYDEDDDNYMRDAMFGCEDKASDIYDAVIGLSGYFSEWICNIDTKNIKPIIKFKELVNSDTDIFITFNYTSTLQDVYDCQNVTHIHGKVGGKLLLGHGCDDFDEEHYEQNYFGAQDSIYQLHNALRKDTKKAILENKDFFDNLDDISKIYSFGFSFSNVDLIYVEEICKNIKSNVTWYLNSFDDIEKMKEFEAIIRGCGFKGEISTY